MCDPGSRITVVTCDPENAVQKSSEQKFNALASLELEHSFLRILYVLAVIVVEEQ